MGGSKLPDWGPTRDPKRNAQIRAENKLHPPPDNEVVAYEKHLEQFRQRRRAKLPFAAQDINLLIPSLLNSWQQQVDSAITDVPYPAEPENAVYWYLALAGNLIWAGTCFLNPAAAAESAVISLLAATVASGTAQKVMGESTLPGPSDSNGAREVLRKQVAQARGKLEKHFQGKRNEWAAGVPRLQDWNTEDAALDAFNKYVWEQMFPWIPYDDDRFDAIRIQAAAMVKEAYANYMRQWQQFVRDAAWYGEATRKKYGIVFKPVIQVSFGGKPLWDAHEVVRPGSPGWEKQLEFH